MQSLPFDLLVITQALPAADVLRDLRGLLCGEFPAGRVALLLRGKHLPEVELAPLAKAARELTRRTYMPLILNGPLAIAKVVGADGVQLPEAGPSVAEAKALLGEGALVGRSCHDEAGLRAASIAGARYATLSPYHAVPGKGPVLPAEETVRLCASVPDLPIVALGGIDPSNVRTAMASGARGVAVIRAVFDFGDPYGAVLDLLSALDAARFSPPTGSAAGAR